MHDDGVKHSDNCSRFFGGGSKVEESSVEKKTSV